MKRTRIESKGLGDTVQKFTTATGIKKVVDTVAKAAEKIVGVEKGKTPLTECFLTIKNK